FMYNQYTYDCLYVVYSYPTRRTSDLKFCPCMWDVKVRGGNEMNMVSSVRHAFVQQKKQPISLLEGQIIQGKNTKIYPNKRAAIQINKHKLIEEITTPLSVRKKYFFKVQ